MNRWRQEVKECECVHVCEYVCVHDTSVSRYVSDCAYVHTHPPHAYIYLCVCVHVYVWVHGCVCVYVFIFECINMCV